jgi:hypothetical protein
MKHTYHVDGSQPNNDQIFVFGSNLSGIHGAGAAKAARLHYGAIQGFFRGHKGKSYAIPTVKLGISGPLPLFQIEAEVADFLVYTRLYPELKFFVTRIGCGLAGYFDYQIAPMFVDVPDNCSLPETWQQYLEKV